MKSTVIERVEAWVEVLWTRDTNGRRTLAKKKSYKISHGTDKEEGDRDKVEVGYRKGNELKRIR